MGGWENARVFGANRPGSGGEILIWTAIRLVATKVIRGRARVRLPPLETQTPSAMHIPPSATVILLVLSSMLHAEEPAPVPTAEAGRWAKEKIASHRPAVITPPGMSTAEQAGAAPSDAVVFFDGTDLSKWKGGGKKEEGAAAPWLVKDGYMEVVRGKGSVETREQIEGDCQWHIEWRTPAEVVGNSQGRGNSGVFIGGYPEVQVLDSFQNDTYPDGQASALYKQSVPLVNASRGPGEWQSYDIICIREKKGADGKVLQAGSITVLHNGIVTQFSVQAGGGQGAGGLSLQDHGNPVRYRNIWARKLIVPPVPAK